MESVVFVLARLLKLGLRVARNGRDGPGTRRATCHIMASLGTQHEILMREGEERLNEES